MLETPQDFVRVKHPLSLSLADSDLVPQRPASLVEKSVADAAVSGAGIGVPVGMGASAVLSDSSSVSSFLQGLWASTRNEAVGQHAVAPSSVVSDALAPLSFGAEPRPWQLQRLDQDFVNAAFQLAPAVVPSSQNTSAGLDSVQYRPASGPGKSSRTLKSAVR